MFDWSGETGLATLFVAAFVSATVLPANSEIVLVAVVRAFPERATASPRRRHRSSEWLR